MWSPKKQSRICSRHFVDNKPTEENPHPSLHLGYNSYNSTVNSRRQIEYGRISNNNDLQNVQNTGEERFIKENSSVEHEPVNRDKLVLPNFIVFRITKYINNVFSVMVTIASLLCFGWLLRSKYIQVNAELEKTKLSLKRYKAKFNAVREKNKLLKENCVCNLPMHQRLLKKPSDCLFYTGIESVSLFEKLSEFIRPYVKRRWLGSKLTSTALKRKFSKQPNRMGPKRKLDAKDEFLMLCMRLRLGLLEQDLANRFNISLTTTSRIVRSWLKVSANILKSFVFIPDQGSLNAVKPPQFKGISNLHTIIDATELFIETPKGLVNQRLTWSNYKHHNTLKILVAVTSNSTIAFVSEAYVGGISDKALTNHCGFLDMVTPYSKLMADKGFNIANECAERHVELVIPPGRRGQSQMLSKAVQKTSSIAKMRILVEQVIREMKTFRVLSQELTISVILQINDIIIVCSALTNLKKPIYK